MSFLDMIEASAGPIGVQQIAQRVGLTPEQLEGVITALAPTLLPKLLQQAAGGGLQSLAGTNPAPGSEEATQHGNTILGTIFGSKDVSRNIASSASTQTGVSADKIKAALPQLATIAAAAVLNHRPLAEGSGGLGRLLGGIEKNFGLG